MKRKDFMKKLRKKTADELRELLRKKELELMKWKGDRIGHNVGYDTKWHPPIRKTKRDIARIKTVLRERKYGR